MQYLCIYNIVKMNIALFSTENNIILRVKIHPIYRRILCMVNLHIVIKRYYLFHFSRKPSNFLYKSKILQMVNRNHRLKPPNYQKIARISHKIAKFFNFFNDFARFFHHKINPLPSTNNKIRFILRENHILNLIFLHHLKSIRNNTTTRFPLQKFINISKIIQNFILIFIFLNILIIFRYYLFKYLQFLNNSFITGKTLSFLQLFFKFKLLAIVFYLLILRSYK